MSVTSFIDDTKFHNYVITCTSKNLALKVFPLQIWLTSEPCRSTINLSNHFFSSNTVSPRYFTAGLVSLLVLKKEMTCEKINTVS